MMNDFILPQEIPFIPGYYLKKSINSGNFDTSDAKYIGTTWDPKVKKVSETYKYLYNVVSLTQYTLVSQYKVPEKGYCYFVSSGIDYVSYYKQIGSTIQRLSVQIPAGVIGVVAIEDGVLKIKRLDRYFKYHGIQRSAENLVGENDDVTFTDLKNNSGNKWVVSGSDNTGAPATAENCIFYPSRFSDGFWKWDNGDAAKFNNLLARSGYKYLHQIKHNEESPNDASLLTGISTTTLNGNEPNGLRYASVRRLIDRFMVGTAKMQGSKYVVAGPWEAVDGWGNNSDNRIRLDKPDSWKDRKHLEFIWSYIMTIYLNSNNPDAAISSLYSDTTGWSTTWNRFYIAGDTYGTVIQANAECGDNVVLAPGTGVLAEISDSNLPCSVMDLVFDIQIGTLSARGLVRLNVGGRKWDDSEAPYRYLQLNRSYKAPNVELLEDSILYKTTVNGCDFILQYAADDNIVTEVVTPRIGGYNNDDPLAQTSQSDSSLESANQSPANETLTDITEPTEISEPENLSDSTAEVLYR